MPFAWKRVFRTPNDVVSRPMHFLDVLCYQMWYSWSGAAVLWFHRHIIFNYSVSLGSAHFCNSGMFLNPQQLCQNCYCIWELPQKLKFSNCRAYLTRRWREQRCCVQSSDPMKPIKFHLSSFYSNHLKEKNLNLIGRYRLTLIAPHSQLQDHGICVYF